MTFKRSVLYCTFLICLVLSALCGANDNWVSFPKNLQKPDLKGQKLIGQWSQLTRATLDPIPASVALQDVWRSHFEGDFAKAKAKGLALGTSEGKYVAYRAQTIYAMYLTPDAINTSDPEKAERTVLLKEVYDQLTNEIRSMESRGQQPSMQLRFWSSYAFARYLEIMKREWGVFVKRDRLNALLDELEKIIGPAASMPSLKATYGGTIAAVSEDGYLARKTFQSRVKDCNGKKASYKNATISQFNCAIDTLGSHPFPELMGAYAKALDQLDIGDSRTGISESSKTYREYATGIRLPDGVVQMVFMSEDILAREAAKNL